jgi:hypothetical protein
MVADVVRRIGDDNIIVSTDYPRIDAQFPHALDEFLAIDDLNDASRKRFSGIIARDSITCSHRRLRFEPDRLR